MIVTRCHYNPHLLDSMTSAGYITSVGGMNLPRQQPEKDMLNDTATLTALVADAAAYRHYMAIVTDSKLNQLYPHAADSAMEIGAEMGTTPDALLALARLAGDTGAPLHLLMAEAAAMAAWRRVYAVAEAAGIDEWEAGPWADTVCTGEVSEDR